MLYSRAQDRCMMCFHLLAGLRLAQFDLPNQVAIEVSDMFPIYLAQDLYISTILSETF